MFVWELPRCAQVIDVRGVGFRTADEIASKIAGSSPTSPGRLQAAVVHALREAAQDGHCCLDADELLHRAVTALTTVGLTRSTLSLFISQHGGLGANLLRRHAVAASGGQLTPRPSWSRRWHTLYRSSWLARVVAM